MANPERGEVALGGLTLKCSMNARCLVEAEAGRPFIQVVTPLGTEGARDTDLRLLVWAFQYPDNARLAIDRVGDVMDDVGMVASVEAVVEAVRLSLPWDMRDSVTTNTGAGTETDPPPTSG